MRVTRIYTGEDGRSHFEDRVIPDTPTPFGFISEVATKGIVFRRSHSLHADWHTAPRRQLIITISGLGELQVGGGETRVFRSGDVLLADDLTGEGHITREPTGRFALMVPLADDFDLAEWPLDQS